MGSDSSRSPPTLLLPILLPAGGPAAVAAEAAVTAAAEVSAEGRLVTVASSAPSLFFLDPPLVPFASEEEGTAEAEEEWSGPLESLSFDGSCRKRERGTIAEGGGGRCWISRMKQTRPSGLDTLPVPRKYDSDRDSRQRRMQPAPPATR